MHRVNLPEEERRPFYLFIDEFQSFSTDSFVSILAEARRLAEHPDFKIELFTGGPPAVLEGKHDGDKLSGKFSQATAEGTFEGARKAEEKAGEGEGGR